MFLSLAWNCQSRTAFATVIASLVIRSPPKSAAEKAGRPLCLAVSDIGTRACALTQDVFETAILHNRKFWASVQRGVSGARGGPRDSSRTSEDQFGEALSFSLDNQSIITRHNESLVNCAR